MSPRVGFTLPDTVWSYLSRDPGAAGAVLSAPRPAGPVTSWGTLGVLENPHTAVQGGEEPARAH